MTRSPASTARRALGAAAAALALGASGLAVAQPQPGTALPPITMDVKPGYVVKRLPNGLPDWSGVWANVGPRNIDPTTDTGTFQPRAPLNAEYAKRYKERLDAFDAGKPITDIGCLPEGVPRIMRAPYSMEIVATPKQTWILLEFKNENRRIYTDGRKPPPDVELTYEGYSTGRWEGDTLVFDTVGIKAGTLDSRGLEHSDALVLHERMRRVSEDTLVDEITMTDPKVFTKPWTVIRQYKHQPTWEIKEFICAENERNPPAADGSAQVILSNPK